MAQDYKILAQISPLATTDTELYTAPSATQTVISTLAVTNRSGSTAGTYRIAVIPSPDELTTEHYIAYDIAIDPNDVALITIGITLGPLDQILIRASSADFTFNLFGVEFSE
jgi:hypothetical protein